MNKKNLLISIILIATIFILRLLPHPANLAPVAAVALVSGLYLSRGNYRILIPLLGLFLSDIILGFYYLPVMIAVYSCFGISYLIGEKIKRHKNIQNVLTGTLLSALIFFLITNFAVWASGSWYPKTSEGLSLAYWLAIPFFKNTLIGDLFYVAVLSGVFELVTSAATVKKKLAAMVNQH